MKKQKWSLFLGIVLFLLFGFSDASAAQPSDVVKFTITLRSNVTVRMGAIVLRNPDAPSNGVTILVLNGTAQTSNTFRPLAGSILTGKLDNKVSTVVLLDHPGHGNSEFPVGDLFGNLTVAD